MKRPRLSRTSTSSRAAVPALEAFMAKNRAGLSRRRFLGGSSLALAASAVHAGTSPTSSNRHITPETRWVRVWSVMEESHPLFPRYDSAGCATLWLDFDRLTGAHEPVPPNDDIYRWPVANALLQRPETVPEDWQPELWPRCLPLPPQDVEWEERAGWVNARKGADQRWTVPRYVITIVNRDVLADLDRIGPRDRRDQLRHHWMHCDLLTGMMVECAADDPLYHSPLAAKPVLI